MRVVGLLLVSAPDDHPQRVLADPRPLVRRRDAPVLLGILASVGGVIDEFLCRDRLGWDDRPARAGSLSPRPGRGAVRPVTHGLHAEQHTHEHGPGADQAIAHGDHVDYLHDGHRHAPHDDHYDEHADVGEAAR